MNLLQNVLFTKLISEGWDKRTATWYLKNKPSCTPDLKRYLALYPYNDLYGKWLIDKNISAKIYHDISSLFPKRYFLLYQKYHKQTIIDLFLSCPASGRITGFSAKTKSVFSNADLISLMNNRSLLV